MPSVCVLLPQDSWSALSLALLVSQKVSDDGRHTDNNHGSKQSHSIADFACRELASQLALAGREDDVLPEVMRVGCVLVSLGEERTTNSRVFIAVPSLGRLYYDGTRRWADYAQWETARWYAAWCRIATVQTVGGGWASLRRADKALACAMELYELALIVGDGDIASKCRVFIGWAHLWTGHRRMALHLFSLEMKDALLRGDLVHQRRCENAIINATTNPTLNGAQKTTSKQQFSLTDCWTRAFAGMDVVGAT